MSSRTLMGAHLLLAACALSMPAVAAADTDTSILARGRYVVTIGGCNDCHTAGYIEKSGQVPEQDWLMGTTVGFRGPWGVTYPANLRKLTGTLSEDQWVARARTPMRPPMPWFNLAEMTDSDLRAMYRYIQSLGAAGENAPAYVAPGAPVTTPVIDFVPHAPEQTPH